MTCLIITEKPSSATKIAEALSDKELIRKKTGNVSYYELEHKGKKILVGCAVGHLYNLVEKDKKGWTYPVFDLIWCESYKISKQSSFTKKYLDILKKLAGQSNEFYVATDYDLEGSLIGFNIVRFVCKKEDGRRMKFSTLTKKELIESYENASEHLDFHLIESGEARHIMDFYWGINLSRALTLSIKNSTGMHKILSSGRVQGPALKILVDREKEIRKFKPVPFWQIELNGEAQGREITALHKEDKFWDKKKAQKSLNNIKGKKAIVDKVEKKEFFQKPPFPFDLTALQLEAYKTLKISPKETLSLAQSLYSNSYISYPRTSSNQLPESLNYKEIIKGLTKQARYEELASELLKGKLVPNNGKKIDPAHPAIYPTGEIPKNLAAREHKLYDLIVKRTLATFSTPAKRETVVVEIDVNNEMFVTKGTRTIEEGWHRFYSPYVMMEEQELPLIAEGDELKIIKISMLSKETQPPKRYTPASIIKELEKKMLGTKATRSQIIDALYERNYVKEKSMEVTDLGMKTVETLEKYCADILDEKLTRHFEEEMEQIRQGLKKPDVVLTEAKEILSKALFHFKGQEKAIGENLAEAHRTTRDREQLVGKCPSCEEGSLRIMFTKGKKKRFVACNQYPSCTTTFSLPSLGLIKTTEKTCNECNYPQVLVIRKGKRPWTLCLNHDCPSKIRWREQQAAHTAIR